MTRNLLALVAVALSTACGDAEEKLRGELSHSCDMSDAAPFTCVEYAAPASQAEAACLESEGIWSRAECPGTHRLACCDLPMLGTLQCWYEGAPTEVLPELQAQCTGAGGTWTQP